MARIEIKKVTVNVNASQQHATIAHGPIDIEKELARRGTYHQWDLQWIEKLLSKKITQLSEIVQ